MLGSPPYSGLSAGDPCAGRDLSPGLRRLVLRSDGDPARQHACEFLKNQSSRDFQAGGNLPGAQRLECRLKGVWGWQGSGVKTVRRVGREGLSSWWALSTPHHTHGQEHFGH